MRTAIAMRNDAGRASFYGIVLTSGRALSDIRRLVRGYRIVTGQSFIPFSGREPMMALVTNMARIVLIVTVATSMSIFGSDIHHLFTQELPTDLNQLFTGDNTTIQDNINKNLAATVLAMAAIDAVQSSPGDAQAVSDKARAADFAIFGTASPPMAIGGMLLLYNFGVALFVGLGPLFILCLIFEKTKPLFQRWLLYGIGTLFSLAMLSFISTIVLSVTLRVATALWATGFINTLTQSQSEGLTTQSMEQGGIGLLMTMLIISVPPMAAMFFQGTLGQFMAYSAFNGAGARPGPQGQPAGSYGGSYGGQGPSNSTMAQNSGSQSGGFNTPNLGQPRQTAATDPGIRTTPQFGNAPTVPPPNNQAS